MFMYHLVIPERPHVRQYFVFVFDLVCEYSSVRDNIFKWVSFKNF